MTVELGIGLALASGLALNWGFFAQYDAASGLPRLSLGAPIASLRALFTNVRWLSGYVVGWIGWGLYIIALHFAPLSVVQAISAAGIGLLVLLTHGKGPRQLRRYEFAGAAAALLGLLLLGVSLIGHVPHSVAPTRASLSIALFALLGFALLALVLALRRLAAGFFLGAVAGLCYAAGDVATKGALIGGSFVLIPLLLACHLAGFIALQHAFQRGGPIATAGTCNLLTNLLPILLGVLIFGEGEPPGLFGVLRTASFGLVVCSCVVLARASHVPAPEVGGAPSDASVTHLVS